MRNISKVFASCRRQGRAALIPYFMAGYPSADAFCRIVKSSFQAGADIVEIGIPYSDPVADGPTIQYAGERALEQGMSVDRVFGLLRSLHLDNDQPLVLMSYYNPVLQRGIESFLTEAADSGVSGLIVPDLVIEEGRKMEAACREANIDLIYLVAPSSSVDRQKAIMKRSRGFVYMVSDFGVTGTRKALPGTLVGRVEALKAMSRMPVAIGFGISSPETAATAAVTGEQKVETTDKSAQEQGGGLPALVTWLFSGHAAGWQE